MIKTYSVVLVKQGAKGQKQSNINTLMPEIIETFKTPQKTIDFISKVGQDESDRLRVQRIFATEVTTKRVTVEELKVAFNGKLFLIGVNEEEDDTDEEDDNEDFDV